MIVKRSHGAILNCMSEAVYVISTAMEILYANPASEILTGYSISEAIDAKCENIFCEPSDMCEGKCPPKVAMRERKSILHREAETKTKDGKIKNAQISFSPFYEGNKCVGAVVVIKDITEIRKAEEQIKRQSEFLALTIDSLPDPFYVIDADSYVIKVANKACRHKQSPEGAKCYAYTHNKTEPCEDEHHPCPLAVVKTTKQPYVVEHLHMGPNGEFRNYEIHGYPILDNNGNVVQMIEYALDITNRKNAEIEREEMQKKLHILSITDDLTGLYSRRGFFSLAEHQLRIAARMRKGLYLLYADIDGLKRVNDKFGHLEGDKLIVKTAEVLKDSFRNSDIIARIGGDEFVIFPVEAEEGSPETVINRLQNKIDRMNKESTQKYPISLSIGKAYYDPSNPCSIEELLHHADISMYEEKNSKTKLK
jgi:two-component system cell cycle response regulator